MRFLTRYNTDMNRSALHRYICLVTPILSHQVKASSTPHASNLKDKFTQKNSDIIHNSNIVELQQNIMIICDNVNMSAMMPSTCSFPTIDLVIRFISTANLWTSCSADNTCSQIDRQTDGRNICQYQSLLAYLNISVSFVVNTGRHDNVLVLRT